MRTAHAFLRCVTTPEKSSFAEIEGALANQAKKCLWILLLYYIFPQKENLHSDFRTAMKVSVIFKKAL